MVLRTMEEDAMIVLKKLTENSAEERYGSMGIGSLGF
jgi:hypothetical protein